MDGIDRDKETGGFVMIYLSFYIKIQLRFVEKGNPYETFPSRVKNCHNAFPKLCSKDQNV